MILEAVAFYDTWIWYSFFGLPGACNDLNVLAKSTVFDELLEGNKTPVDYEINGKSHNLGYYVADGIYPPYTIIVKSFKRPATRKQSVFARYQEGARKDVEHAFGILQQKFHFIKNSTRLRKHNDLKLIMKSCIILHNLIQEDEQLTY